MRHFNTDQKSAFVHCLIFLLNINWSYIIKKKKKKKERNSKTDFYYPSSTGLKEQPATGKNKPYKLRKCLSTKSNERIAALCLLRKLDYKSSRSLGQSNGKSVGKFKEKTQGVLNKSKICSV